MRFTFTERAAPFAEVGYGDPRIAGATAAAWDIHRWDDPLSIWSGTEPTTWRDISCDVWDFTCEYGRAALSDRFVPGSASFVVRNASGWADPERLGMRPGRSIRVGINHDVLGRVILFRGFIDAVVPTYSPGYMDQVTFEVIDALAEVNRAKLSPFDPPQGDGQLGHERIIDILDRARWPSSKRDIWPSSWTLLEDAQGGQVADLLGRIADSVGGSVWGNTEANVAFRPRDWQLWPADQPVDATIGNVEDTDVCPGAWQRPFDRASISTQVVMGRDVETAVVVEDEPGQILYGIEPFERTDLLTKDDFRIVNLAERAMTTRSHETAPRVRSVAIDARNGDEQLDLMAGIDVFKPSHYRCRLQQPRGLVFDDRYIATAVAHRITAAEWSVEMNLDLAGPYVTTNMAARWDISGWDESAWADPAIVPPAVIARVSGLIEKVAAL